MDPDSSSFTSSEGSQDLGLDPSDPLNLLLHNTSQDGSEGSPAAQTPPDWSQVSSMWPYLDNDGKSLPDLVDFSMDLDSSYNMLDASFNMYDPKTAFHDSSTISINDLLSSNPQNFPFTFQTSASHTQSNSSEESHRRLSITSSSSSSGGASFSSVSESSHQGSDAAAELARRVRQTAGVLLAVPAGSQATHSPIPQQQMPPSSDIPVVQAVGQTNIIPFSTSPSSSSSAASTPPPATPPMAGPGGTMGMIGRPKTSHTTIERRYRTNLNARIQSLRMAVPALRVLENRQGRKVKANVPYGKVRTITPTDEEIVDEVDERGFVDGVKVARKCSKANVLGKAVEYIRVLKKREERLKREQNGLKSLVEGLVGGPALLREWEREWKEKFGGEEKDEVEDEQIDDGGSDESGDEDDEDDGRRKKKQKKEVIPPPARPVKERKPALPPQPTIPGVVPEKRKRGRPRKVVPPPVVAAPVMPSMFVAAPTQLQYPSQQLQYPPEQPQEQASESSSQSSDGRQYLLAVFALFSFFNTPLPTNSPFGGSYEWNHKTNYTGHVLAPHPPLVPPPLPEPAWGWSEWIQTFHLVVSVVVFASILLPWIPVKTILRHFAFRGKLVSASAPAARDRARPESTLASVLQFQKRGTSTEAADIRQALDTCNAGIWETLKRVMTGKVTATSNFERKGLEQRAWVRLGEIAVYDGNTSYWSRVQTFWHMRAHLSWFTCSVGDLSTLALVVYPISKTRAESIWGAGRARKGVLAGSAHERLVLESMNVNEAIQSLQEPGCDRKLSPVAGLAHKLVRQRIKRHLETEFVRLVREPGSAQLEETPSLAGSVQERRLIDSARSLGGRIAELGDVLDRGFDLSGTTSAMTGPEGIDGEISSLLGAVSLYRQVFPSALAGSSTTGVSILLSPAPSCPAGKQQALRRALGSPVFEGNDMLEDARDRVVDMLCEGDNRRS